MARETLVYDPVQGKCVPKDEYRALQAQRDKGKPRRADFLPNYVERGTWVLVGGKLVPKHEHVPRARRASHQVLSDIEPFVNVGIDGKVIGGRKQRRDMMRAHGVIDVGNEKLTRPATKEYRPTGLQQDIKAVLERHGW